MDKWLRENQKRLRAVYGAMPAHDCQKMRLTLAQIKEEVPVKRKAIGTIILAVMLMILFIGAAFAIGNQLGVLRFIERESALPEQIKREVQTEFSQEGGDTTDVSFRVRDAISDGRTLFITVEAKAKNPADALLLSFDMFDWNDQEAMDFWRATRDRDEASYPDCDAYGDQRIHDVFSFNRVQIECAGQTMNDLAVGNSYCYEGTDTIVNILMIDVRTLQTDDLLRVTFYPALGEKIEIDEPLPENAAPTYTFHKVLEETTLIADIKLGNMPSRRAVADTPFTYTDFTINQLEVVQTPLATYVSVTKRLDVSNEKRNAWFEVCDAEGVMYKDLVYDHIYSQEALEAYDESVPFESIFATRGDLPEALTLRAMSMSDNPDYVIPEDLLVRLHEIIE